MEPLYLMAVAPLWLRRAYGYGAPFHSLLEASCVVTICLWLCGAVTGG